MIPMNEIKIQGTLLFHTISKNTKIAEQRGTLHPGSPGTSPAPASRPELSGNKRVSSAFIPVCSSTNGLPGGSPFGSDRSYTPLSRFRQ